SPARPPRHSRGPRGLDAAGGHGEDRARRQRGDRDTARPRVLGRLAGVRALPRAQHRGRAPGFRARGGWSPGCAARRRGAENVRRRCTDSQGSRRAPDAGAFGAETDPRHLGIRAGDRQLRWRGRLSAPRVFEGEVVARGRKVAIVAARFNDFIVASLLKGATTAWLERGGPAEDLVIARVPGAFELPVAARRLALSGRYDAVVALGCVIRGDTPHFEYVSGECARGLQLASLET